MNCLKSIKLYKFAISPYSMSIEFAVNDFYDFFGMEYVSDPTTFNRRGLNIKYRNMMKTADTTELKEKIKSMYNQFYNIIKKSLIEYTPKHDVETEFNEFVASLKKGSEYR